jgi:hypothetical protein
MPDLFRLPLRDFPVLAIETSEIASRGCYGKYGSSRVEMIQGFLFNGINVHRTWVSIG